MSIGSRIKELRIKKGLTQTELAELLGYSSKSSVAHLEHGRDIPRSLVVKLAKTLDTTPSYLMGWDELPPNYNDVLSELAAVEDRTQQVQVLSQMNTKQLLELLDDITKALQEKQH